jgi:hypothetical protein
MLNAGWSGHPDDLKAVIRAQQAALRDLLKATKMLDRLVDPLGMCSMTSATLASGEEEQFVQRAIAAASAMLPTTVAEQEK